MYEYSEAQTTGGAMSNICVVWPPHSPTSLSMHWPVRGANILTPYWVFAALFYVVGKPELTNWDTQLTDQTVCMYACLHL